MANHGKFVVFFCFLVVSRTTGQPFSDRDAAEEAQKAVDPEPEDIVNPAASRVYPSLDEIDPGLNDGVKEANRPLSFAAFNIQIFGKKKMQQQDVVNVLVKILLRYDLILIQEIRDSEDKWTLELLNVLNGQVHEDDKYQMILSERLGRSSSKEQYGFFYRTRLLQVRSSFHYDDGEEIEGCKTDTEQTEKPVCTDTFQREPFIVRFSSKTTAIKDFSIIACHVDPGEAVKEIDALYDVYKTVKTRYGTTEVIIAGDLNAGCSYMPKKYWDSIRLRDMTYWDWLIPDSADTTTGRSDCAYDRFIISRRGKLENGGIIKESAKVFDFQQHFGLDDDLTKRVSDHYPIELQLLPDNSLSRL